MKDSQATPFGRNLLTCIGSALVICLTVELACTFYGIAPLFTQNLTFNEKLRFIRDHRPNSTPVGVISGASIALNDVDSDLLQDVERQPFINLGAIALPITSTQRLYEQVTGIFHVREVIFAADPLEMHDAFRADVEVPTDVFDRYVSGRMTIFEEFTYRDISGLSSYWKNWSDYHSHTSPTSLVFSMTGDVPLDINKDNAEPRLWNGETIFPDITCAHCTENLAAFCDEVRGQGQPFTILLGPIREEVLERYPEIRALDHDRRARINAVVKKCGGAVFDVTQFATLNDACFANSIHLNMHGMRALTEQFVRFRRGDTLPTGMLLSCDEEKFSSNLSPAAAGRVR
jgi:hypothetical protein